MEIDTPVPTRYRWSAPELDRSAIQAAMMDMDGSSTDTEKLVLEAMRQMMGTALGRSDFRFADTDYPHIIGDSTTNHVTWLLRQYGLAPADRDRLIALYYQRYHATLEGIRDGLVADRLIEPMPFLREFLLGLKARNIKIGLVTSSLRKEVDIVMPEVFAGMGLDRDYRSFYDGVISAESAGEPFLKPHPNLYVLMGAMLGVTGRNAFVVEDSTAGIIAARLAGFSVYAVPHQHTRQHTFEQANLGVAREGLREIWEHLLAAPA